MHIKQYITFECSKSKLDVYFYYIICSCKIFPYKKAKIHVALPAYHSLVLLHILYTNI